MQKGKKSETNSSVQDATVEDTDLNDSASADQVTDCGRRQIIKRSVQLAAAAYVAPATLQLLTATRATAQSVQAEACCSTIDVTNDEISTDPIHMHYTRCGEAFATVLSVAVGATEQISVEPGTNILIHILGYVGTATITANTGTVGNVTGSGTGDASVTVLSCGPGSVTAVMTN